MKLQSEPTKTPKRIQVCIFALVGKPGRVATLVEEQGEVTHGIAMELKGEEALDYLNNRYKALMV